MILEDFHPPAQCSFYTQIAKTKAIRAAYIRHEMANPGFSKGETAGAAGARSNVGGVKGLGLLEKDT